LGKLQNNLLKLALKQKRLTHNCNTLSLTALIYTHAGTQKKKVKGRFIGLFQQCGCSAYCVLTLNKFPHSSPEAPHIVQMHETSASEGGNYYQ